MKKTEKNVVMLELTPRCFDAQESLYGSHQLEVPSDELVSRHVHYETSTSSQVMRNLLFEPSAFGGG